MELKTHTQWAREGRVIRKGEHAAFYRVDDDRIHGRALFSREQTDQAGGPDEADHWTITIAADEWEQIKADLKAAQRGPRVKIRKLEPAGTAVWCGPDKDIIELLRYHGYRFNPNSRYWENPNKDAEQVARGFENGRIRDLRIKVTRDWGAAPEGVVI